MNLYRVMSEKSISSDRDVIAAIDHELPELARSVIARHLDLSDPCNREFARCPDDRDQHQKHWHQWGIITHTRVFLHLFDTDVPRYLEQWGILSRVDAVLNDPIDGVTRWRLLRIAILLHDIGKFGARTHSQTGFHFAQHERLSGQIIRQEYDLTRFGLTPAQIEYIALAAEDHFVLGLVRKKARGAGAYDRQFVDSPTFLSLSEQIKVEHPADFVEIGVLFLGDSLAKADPAQGPEQAVSQHDINIAVARRYLIVVLGTPDL
jgi:hypothetical protein